MNGYKRYLISNGLLNLDKLGFSSYMKTEAFQKLLSESIGDLLEDSGLEEQFADVLQQNMQAVMETYSTQLARHCRPSLLLPYKARSAPPSSSWQDSWSRRSHRRSKATLRS